MTKELTEGWGFPGASRKAHYFLEDAKSLCGKWMYTGRLEAPKDIKPHKDNCTDCFRRLEKRVARDAA
jgi:hypothetical protein